MKEIWSEDRPFDPQHLEAMPSDSLRPKGDIVGHLN